VRCCRLIDMTSSKGRPQVHMQIGDMGEDLHTMAISLHVMPNIV